MSEACPSTVAGNYRWGSQLSGRKNKRNKGKTKEKKKEC